MRKEDELKLTDQQGALIDELVRVGADIVARQMTKASAGNLSIRDPEDKDSFFVTNSGGWLDQLDRGSFAKMSVGGEILEGTLEPSTEWRMHARGYAARKDALAIIHAHPKHSVLLDALNKKIRFFTLDHISYVRSYGLAPFEPNGSSELAEDVAAQFEHHDVVIMSHHGAVALGDSVTAAYRKVLNLEDAAEMTYRALILGDETSAFPENQTLSVHN